MRQLTWVLGVLFTWSAPANAAPAIITGVVTDEAGQPVADADVWAWQDYFAQPFTTRTDEQGSFRLEFEAGDHEFWEVCAMAPGMALAHARWARTASEPVAFPLVREATVRGIVRNANGDPIAHAVVRPAWLRSPGADEDDFAAVMGFGQHVPLWTAADAGGRFELGHLPRGATVTLRVVADGFAHWDPYAAGNAQMEAGAAKRHEIVLQRAAVVEGTVTHNGEPVEGITVMAEPAHCSAMGDRASTDKDGRYRLSHMAQGTFNVMLYDTDDLVAPAHEEITVTPGDVVADMDFALVSGGVIEGRMIDADTGEAVPDGRAASYGPARPRSSGACISVQADEDGLYRMRVAPSRSYVYYQGGAAAYPFDETGSFEIDVAEGQTVQAPALKVRRVGPLEVRVVGADGRSVGGARVEWFLDFKLTSPIDTEGRCEIPGVKPGRPVIFIARDTERGLCGAATVRAAHAAKPVTIQLLPATAIELRFVDRDYAPIAGIEARVALTADAPREADLRDLERYVYAVIGRATSDQDGLARFEALPAGHPPGVLDRAAPARRLGPRPSSFDRCADSSLLSSSMSSCLAPLSRKGEGPGVREVAKSPSPTRWDEGP